MDVIEHDFLGCVCMNVRRVNARLCLSCAQKAENIAYVAGELFSGGGTPSLRSVFRSVSRTLRAPSTPHHKHNQARQAGRFWVYHSARVSVVSAPPRALSPELSDGVRSKGVIRT